MEERDAPSMMDLRMEIEELKREVAVQGATQAGAQSTQAATQAGQASTTAASQAGLAATNTAAQMGTMSTMAAGFVALVVGIFLGLAMRNSEHRR
jgi:hypothetical protein